MPTNSRFSLCGALWLVVSICGSIAPGLSAETLDPDRWERELIVPACTDPMAMEVLSDGRLLIAEKSGALKLYEPNSGSVFTVARLPVNTDWETGLIGLCADPKFDENHWIYVIHRLAAVPGELRLSRFTLSERRLVEDSERILLRWAIDEQAAHCGGGMVFDRHGNLIIGTGDNSPPILEVPTDQRADRLNFDSLRSAGNTQDLRGKVLRITPQADGTYLCPPDNLFASDPTVGRPEIYAMGCRNAFRVSADPASEWIYFGDVGPNIDITLGIGPNGYDEVNGSDRAGNFGWPLFIGKNEAFRRYDFETKTRGELPDPSAPENYSHRNIGARVLPPARAALIAYPTMPSSELPSFGSGGRSVMVGPMIRSSQLPRSGVHVPEALDGHLVIYEWMRNWIKAVKFDEQGCIISLIDIAPNITWRKPMDIKVGPQGELYVLEFGNNWGGNVDAQVARLVYRRGNRPPVARLTVNPLAGLSPLHVVADASSSTDKDNAGGDPELAQPLMRFAWRVDDQLLADQTAATASIELQGNGRHRISVTVSDHEGAESSAEQDVWVGNAPAELTFAQPDVGGFFDWDQLLGYDVTVVDAEDGSTLDNSIPFDGVTVRLEYRTRTSGPPAAASDPGLSRMQTAGCFGCHAAQAHSKGPSYSDVARRYREQPPHLLDALAEKVIRGGSGVWGTYPMPPHPQFSESQAKEMIDWIVREGDRESAPNQRIGTRGVLELTGRPGGPLDCGVMVLEAAYTDRGAADVGPLRSTKTIVLHHRRKQAALCDLQQKISVVHDLEGEQNEVVWAAAGGGIAWERMNLGGIDRADFRVGGRGGGGVWELRLDRPDGPLLAEIDTPPDHWQDVSVAIHAPLEEHTVWCVARAEPGAELGFHHVTFHNSRAQNIRQDLLNKEWTVQLRQQRADDAAAQAARAAISVQHWDAPSLANALADPSLTVDPLRGAATFTAAGCRSCHARGSEGGGKLGPPLDHLPQRWQAEPELRSRLIQSLLDPSAEVDPAYRTWQVVTVDGEVLAGVIASQDEQQVRLRCDPLRPDDERIVARDDIESIVESPQSLMPAGLLDPLSPQQIVDLLEYVLPQASTAAR